MAPCLPNELRLVLLQGLSDLYPSVSIGFLGIAMSAYEIHEQVNEDGKAEEQQRRYDQQLQEERAQIHALADAMAAQLRDVYQKFSARSDPRPGSQQQGNRRKPVIAPYRTQGASPTAVRR